MFDPVVVFLSRHWQGKGRLWSAYWLIGFLGKIAVLAVIFGVYAAAGATAKTETSTDGLLGAFALVLTLGWFLFAAVSIWRCADNVRWAPFGFLARAVVVLGCFSLLVNLFQLAADMHT
jgi:hypothetical protein